MNRTKVDKIGPMWTEWDQCGLSGTEIDLIGPNKNCLIFRENKLSSTNFREQIIYYITITK